MTVNYTTNLSLGLPVTGTESGTWGDDVNNAITAYLDISIAGGLAVTVTTTDVTLTNTQGTNSATNIGSTTAQYAILNISGAMTAARNLIVPSSSKWYIVNNACTGGYLLTVKGTATSGVTLTNGEKALLFWNGSDYVKVATLGGTGALPLPVGTTAQQPASPTQGSLRFNTTTSQFEGYTGTAWASVNAAGSNTQIQFNNSGLFGASSNLTWSGTTLAVTGALTATADSTFSSTGALTVSKGTTVQQPASPATGMVRYNTTSNEFEGYSGASPSWKSIGGSALSNDTSTTSNLYPVFAAATSGTAQNLYTGNAKLLYKPSTGELQASEMVAGNGLFVNATSIAASYTIASGYNAQSVGPVTIASGQSVTVTSGQRWLVF